MKSDEVKSGFWILKSRYYKDLVLFQYLENNSSSQCKIDCIDHCARRNFSQVISTIIDKLKAADRLRLRQPIYVHT